MKQCLVPDGIWNIVSPHGIPNGIAAIVDLILFSQIIIRTINPILPGWSKGVRFNYLPNH
jgi:hypothetical protein